ncbi:hypothetical protein FOMG_02263 [Fusarium oxysporum f. sp. melonis 26406]|uniref:Uncharacterized protein n=1 Tax=Fusarium oxysporum f. sp. melonis 26406 TaxID=1089452 RepID=X0BY28_FUSOX|nr:hypothetical protein FOMG_02263 [Fusarium oxysporum f. sp. melonis 26406]
MPETSYPDYDLLPAVFEAWLQERFDDDTISVEVSLRILPINLPNGYQLKHGSVKTADLSSICPMVKS